LTSCDTVAVAVLAAFAVVKGFQVKIFDEL
jgi:hypothetical protein